MDTCHSFVFVSWPCLFKAHSAGTTWVEQCCLGAWAVLAPVSKVSIGMSLGPSDGDQGIIPTSHTQTTECTFGSFIHIVPVNLLNRKQHLKTSSLTPFAQLIKHTTHDSVLLFYCTNKPHRSQRTEIWAGASDSWRSRGGYQPGTPPGQCRHCITWISVLRSPGRTTAGC